MLGKKCNIKNDREYKTTSYRFVFFNILTNSIGLIVLFIQNGNTKGDLVLIKECIYNWNGVCAFHNKKHYGYLKIYLRTNKLIINGQNCCQGL